MGKDRDTDVLVVGAGPTGLACALWLARAGVSVRVIDKQAQPGTASRAVGVAARTLELYRQLGIADEVIAAGWQAPAANMWVRGEKRARFPLGDIGAGISPYAYELMYPQGDHERLLIRHLDAAGVRVERPRALASLAQDDAGVTAQLDDGTACRAAYLVGCDGAHSAVRAQLGIGLPGGTYEHVFFVVDLDADGAVMDGELHISFDTADFLAAFPLARGRARVVGTVRGREIAAWDDVASAVRDRLQIGVTHVRDFSTYKVHHRVADRFRRGRAFLCGDAAHLHSPVAAQGMNTGIGDAVNVAWKLAAVLGGAPVSLLDSFEPERIGFARRLVATTDRVFQLVSHDGGVARVVRTDLTPLLFRLVAHSTRIKHLAFRMLSQTALSYRDSPLAAGRTGALRGGDRLPWLARLDNFAPLASRAWQLHVYGEAKPQLRDAGLPVHAFTWSDDCARAGLLRGAAYLLRPDGYLGWTDEHADPASLARYLAGVR